MFPEFKDDVLYALDLDGVIIDSIQECYRNSVITFTGKDHYNPKEKKLFLEYRGLVQPAYEYYYLMESIHECLKKETDSIKELFANYREEGASIEAKLFEKRFFMNRLKLQNKNMESWMELNPLTKFGKHIQVSKPKKFIIITTKNNDSVKAIIEYYALIPQCIYANDQVKKAGTKGELLNTVLSNSCVNDMVFVDDSTEHLETVKNANIQCYFADWGYGNNKGYKVFKK